MPKETKQERIIRQVRAMLNTAGNAASTSGEAEAAMGMATHLMDKYNLDRNDIAHLGDSREVDFTNVEFTKTDVFQRALRAAHWQKLLAKFVEDFVETVGAYHQSEDSKIVFYGPACDVAIACSIFRHLEETIYHQAMLEYGSWAKSKGACFAEGYVSGMRDKMQASKEVLERGLILTNQNEKIQAASEAWLADGGTALVKGKGSRRKRDPEAEASGYQRGQEQKVGHQHKVK